MKIIKLSFVILIFSLILSACNQGGSAPMKEQIHTSLPSVSDNLVSSPSVKVIEPTSNPDTFELKYYKIQTNDRIPLVLSQTSLGSFEDFASTVDISRRTSSIRSTISYVNGLGAIKNLRKMDTHHYYCIFDDKNNGRLFVIFSEIDDKTLMTDSVFYIKRKLLFNDFKFVKKDVTTYKNILDFDSATELNKNMFYDGGSKFISVHPTVEGYVIINYKKVHSELIVEKIERKVDPLMKKINSIDFP